jgi:hypothetical protein
MIAPKEETSSQLSKSFDGSPAIERDTTTVPKEEGFNLNEAIPFCATCCCACVLSFEKCLPLGGSCELFGIHCKQECLHDCGQLCTCFKITKCCAIDSFKCCNCEGGRCCHFTSCNYKCCNCSHKRGCCAPKQQVAKPASHGPSIEMPAMPHFTGPKIQGHCMKCEFCPGKPIHFGSCNVKNDCCGLDCFLCGIAMPCTKLCYGIYNMGCGMHCLAGGPCMLVCMGCDMCFAGKIAIGCCCKMKALHAKVYPVKN